MSQQKSVFKLRETLSRSKAGKLPRIKLLSRILNRLRSVNLFYVISAAFQVITGLLATSASMLSLIRPMWLAALLSLLGCVITMLGIYQFYDIMKSSRGTQDLARDAIERAIKSRN